MSFRQISQRRFERLNRNVSSFLKNLDYGDDGNQKSGAAASETVAAHASKRKRGEDALLQPHLHEGRKKLRLAPKVKVIPEEVVKRALPKYREHFFSRFGVGGQQLEAFGPAPPPSRIATSANVEAVSRAISEDHWVINADIDPLPSWPNTLRTPPKYGGNVHHRIRPPTPRDPSYEPLAPEDIYPNLDDEKDAEWANPVDDFPWVPIRSSPAEDLPTTSRAPGEPHTTFQPHRRISPVIFW